MGWIQTNGKSPHEIRSELKELCTKMIDILRKVKDCGSITEDEYVEHTRLKKIILS